MTTKEAQGLPQDTIQAVAWRVEFDGKWSFAEKDPRAFWPKAEPLGLLSDIRLLSEANAALEVERSDLRSRLFPYADDKEISGMSWNGFYLIGNRKSIKELRRIENAAAQIEVFRQGFEEHKAAHEAALSAATLEIERLKGALEPFARIVDLFKHLTDDGGSVMVNVRLGDLRNTKSVLAASKAEAAEPKDCYCGGTSDYHRTGCPEAAEQRSHDLEGGDDA